jgi:hypothetical protein
VIVRGYWGAIRREERHTGQACRKRLCKSQKKA